MKTILVCGKSTYSKEDLKRILEAGLKAGESGKKIRSQLEQLTRNLDKPLINYHHDNPDMIDCIDPKDIDWKDRYKDKVMEDNGFKK